MNEAKEEYQFSVLDYMAPDFMVAFWHHVHETFENDGEISADRQAMLDEIKKAFDGNCGLECWRQYEKDFLWQRKALKAAYAKRKAGFAKRMSALGKRKRK